MADSRTICQMLAPLILQDNVPMTVIATIGEIIAIDARLQDYDTTPAKKATFDELDEFYEAYGVLLQRVRSIVSDFSRTQDRIALMEALPQIRDGLAALQ